MPTPLKKVSDSTAWLQRHRNLEEAGRMRWEKTIREAHADGEPIAVIARVARVSRPTIYRVLTRS